MWIVVINFFILMMIFISAGTYPNENYTAFWAAFIGLFNTYVLIKIAPSEQLKLIKPDFKEEI